MSAKKFVAIFTVLLLIFFVFNFALWHFVTKRIFTQNDLNRMGYTESTKPLIPNAEYKAKRTEFTDYIISGIKTSFDIVTIGDSFSNGGGNTYFQDYLEEKYNLKVLNVNIINTCLSDLYTLVYSGFLDEIRPEAVIIESVGRYVYGRLTEKVESQILYERQRVKNIITGRIKTSEKADEIAANIFTPVMIKFNMNFLFNRIYNKFNPEKLSREAYRAELTRNLFSNPGYENVLIYFYEDLNYINIKINAEKINKNLNDAAKILREKNIKLIFMPCSDKYDLYYPYIKDKRGRPENELFSQLRKVPDKEYIFIDTKAILQKALERGEKDIYWYGDTHWSFKGGEIVCDELVKCLMPK